MLRLQRIPRLDLRTVQTVEEWIDSQVERTYGKPIPDEFQAWDKRVEQYGNPTGDLRMRRSWDVQRSAPALDPDVNAVAATYGPLFEEVDALARQGVYYQTFDKVLRELRGTRDLSRQQVGEAINRMMTPVLNYLAQQSLSKWHRIQAGKAAAHKDWETALKELESSAHVGDPLRPAHLIGNLIAVAVRSIAYGGYADLLAADLPAETERAALQSLIGLRATDPLFSNVILAIERREQTSWLLLDQSLTRASYPFGQYGVALYGVVGELAPREGSLRDPRLRAWAQRFERAYLRKGDELGLYVAVFRHGGIRWTTTPSAVKWLKQVAENEPAALQDSFLPDVLRQGLDPWTLVLLSTGWMGGNLRGVNVRTRVTQTKGRLAEIAFAARLYRRQHRQWPERVEDLVPEYLPPIAETPATQPAESSPFGEPTGPYTPFQIAWRDCEEPLRSALWGQFLPRVATGASQPYLKQSGGEGTIDLASPGSAGPGSDDWRGQPVIPLALAEVFRFHPKLVLEARAWKADSAPLASDSPLWQPLDPDYARRVTDETDAEKWSSPPYSRDESKLPPDKRGPNRPHLTERTVPPPASVRLTARLRAPEKILVAWSPGPDGADDGGRLAYDPTNGTTSRGDLLAFPEGY